MPPLPTMSLRCPPEHHQLIRDIAVALRAQPNLAASLSAMLAGNKPQQPEPNQPALAEIAARLEVVEKWIAERNATAMHRHAITPGRVSETQAVRTRTQLPHDTDVDAFLQQVREALSAKGWSSRDLAYNINTSPHYTREILNGNARRYSEFWEAIATALGISAPTTDTHD